ncbi:RES family NAD+ phosphorylase [Mucilaginibacter sp. SMC90]|uniref:RES family NAD+ phosphorylase n=1 Tax=Mucilaginibacter sp. SMC90 TaxID=2929803 RepID=UPI001FB4D44B|nr:RES family NAD+ phosphorylase [Mucilaginibacter sp. SMC90]UOE50164.1 RES family NAD+ phosphorylase [Mucilaginibacter sp. SMC90]
MIVYRLSKQAYIKDLSGRGAELNGGRWNSKGTAVVYTSSSRALAVLEVAVHTPLGFIPSDYFMATIELPNDSAIFKLEVDQLPEKWNSNPLIKATQQIGDSFVKASKYLALQVPSATVAGDFNYLLNPLHPDFKSVKIITADFFEFDSRLFKK